jgi:hypothetical protein
MIKSRRIERAGHVARIAEMRSACRISAENPDVKM